MEKGNRGRQQFFSILASLIRITDFILAGGGYLKNIVWIILAAIVAYIIGHAWHIGPLGWVLFIVAAFVARVVVEAALVALAIWVGQHLPDTATMELEPDHSVRPYRFGTAWAILNLAGSVYYAWRAVQSLHDETWAGFIYCLFGSLVCVGIGIGLLRKTAYGFGLLYGSILIGCIYEVYDWFQESENPPLDRNLTAIGIFGVAVLVAGYFYKRRKEFV